MDLLMWSVRQNHSVKEPLSDVRSPRNRLEFFAQCAAHLFPVPPGHRCFVLAHANMEPGQSGACSLRFCVLTQGFIELRRTKQDVFQSLPHRLGTQCLRAHHVVGVQRIHHGT